MSTLNSFLLGACHVPFWEHFQGQVDQRKKMNNLLCPSFNFLPQIFHPPISSYYLRSFFLLKSLVYSFTLANKYAGLPPKSLCNCCKKLNNLPVLKKAINLLQKSCRVIFSRLRADHVPLSLNEALPNTRGKQNIM